MIATHMHKTLNRARVVGAALAFALGAGALLGLSGCEKDTTPVVDLNVVVTQEMTDALAAQGVENPAKWLQAAADDFVAAQEGVYLTITVVTESAEQLAVDMAATPADFATEDDKKGAKMALAYADEGEDADTDGDADAEGEGAGETDGEGTEPAEGDGTEGTDGAAEGADAEGDDAADPAAGDTQMTVTSAPAPEVVVPKGQANVLPNIVFASFADIAPAIYTGKVLPLDANMAPGYAAQVPAAFLAAGQSAANGLTYMLPTSVSQKVLVYNADLLMLVDGLEEFIKPAYIENGEDSRTKLPTTSEFFGEEPTVEIADALVLESAVLQTWTREQWERVLSVLTAELPGIAHERMLSAVDEWTTAVGNIEQAADAAGEDPTEALKELGEKPELIPMYSLPLYMQGDEGLEWLFVLTRLFGSDFFGQDGFVQVENAEGKAAIEWLQGAVEAGVFPEGFEDLTYEDCLQLFLNNQLAFMLIDPQDIPALLAGSVTEKEYQTTPNRWGDFETTTVIEMVKQYGFVAMPSWSVTDAAYDPEEGLTADEEGNIVFGPTACIVPSEFYGVAVLNNGDDLAIELATEFVASVLNNATLMAKAASATQKPVRADLLEAAAGTYFFADEMAALTPFAVNLSGNAAAWAEVRAAYPEIFQVMFTPEKTPTEVAAAMNAACNAFIQKAYVPSVVQQ